MKIPYNILIQIKMSVRPYFKGFTLIFFFYNCRKQDFNITLKYYKMYLTRVFPGVRQLKIHKSSKSGLVAAFFVSSP